MGHESWNLWNAEPADPSRIGAVDSRYDLILTEARRGVGLTTPELVTLLLAPAGPIRDAVLRAARSLVPPERSRWALRPSVQANGFELVQTGCADEADERRWELCPCVPVARFRTMKHEGSDGALIAVGRYGALRSPARGVRGVDSWHLHGIQFALEAGLSRVGGVLMLPRSGGEWELAGLHHHLSHLVDEYDDAFGPLVLWPDPSAPAEAEGERGEPVATLMHWVASLRLSLPGIPILLPDLWHRHDPSLGAICEPLGGTDAVQETLRRLTDPVVLAATSGWKG